MTRTFTIITTADNAIMAELHNRMPVVLEEEDRPVGLGEAVGDPGTLLRPAAEGVLRVWPVSRRVNAVRNEGPDLLEPVRGGGAETASGPA